MHRGPSTEASNLFNDLRFNEAFDGIQSKKGSDPLLTPQRKDETLRKQLLENRLSKTEDGKRNSPVMLKLDTSINIKSAIFSSYTDKQIKYTGCNCRKSQCLKMYCTCFAIGKMCDETCLCDSCKNDHDNMDRSQAINQIIEKDPLAFSKKTEIPNLAFEDDFCNCRKSNCTKKYCDCYRRGKVCGQKCQCTDCNNCNGNQDLERNSDSQTKKKLKL